MNLARVGTVLILAAGALVAPLAGQTPTGKGLPPVQSVSMVRKLAPVYPLDHLLKGKAGWAEIRFMVDYSGRPVMTTVAGTSDPAFGAALLAEIESNEFMPPRINGQPQLTLSAVRHEFSGEAALNLTEKRLLAELKKIKPAFVSAKELDAPLKSVRQDAPVFPYALQSDGISGRAEIEFIVEKEGQVYFPRIVNASSEDFGWAAATAISRWRYAPPMKGGQKVDARATVVVNFDHAKGTATW
jgi:TonB family protein